MPRVLLLMLLAVLALVFLSSARLSRPGCSLFRRYFGRAAVEAAVGAPAMCATVLGIMNNFFFDG